MQSTLKLSSWILDQAGGLLREPSRPPAYREPGFNDVYDFTTVFCDVFWSADGCSIFVLGPPLLNLEQELELSFASEPGGHRCGHKIQHLDRVDRIEVAAPPGTEKLIVKTCLGDRVLAPQPNLLDVFRDKRVILTINKDNDLAWIRDWARFHRHHHGCDAVLLYDNGSTRYSADQLQAALSGIEGIDAVAVIDWPFPWGAMDAASDSKFCQMVMFEHARLRCLSGAKSVLQGDVDELVLTTTGESAFELAERSAGGYLRYRGLWVEAVTGNAAKDRDGNGGPVRHRNFSYVRHDVDKAAAKWICYPGKQRRGVQWSPHLVRGAGLHPSTRDAELASRISLRHFKAINNGWRIDRSKPIAYDPKLHHLDKSLAGAMDAAFGVSTQEIASDIAADIAGEPSTVAEAAKSSTPVGERAKLERAAFHDWSITLNDKIAAAERLIEQVPENPRFRYLLSRLQRKRDDIDGAISSLRSAIDLDPSYARVHHDLGLLYTRQRRIPEAVEAMERAVEIDPNFFGGYQELSHLYALVGRTGDAVEAAKRALDRRQGDPALRNHLGNLLAQEGEYEEAAAAQLEAIELGMAGPGMYRNLALLHARSGALAKALLPAFQALRGYGNRILNEGLK